MKGSPIKKLPDVVIIGTISCMQSYCCLTIYASPPACSVLSHRLETRDPTFPHPLFSLIVLRLEATRVVRHDRFRGAIPKKTQEATRCAISRSSNPLSERTARSAFEDIGDPEISA